MFVSVHVCVEGGGEKIKEGSYDLEECVHVLNYLGLKSATICQIAKMCKTLTTIYTSFFMLKPNIKDTIPLTISSYLCQIKLLSLK